jgi:hypothetical protein
MNDVAFYVVQNSEGKYFRRKGYGGSGNSWVEEIEKARVWVTLAGARTVVGFFASRYPEYPVPQIIKLVVTQSIVIDETERIKTLQLKKKQKQEKAEILEAKRRFEQAEKDLKAAQTRYEKARKDV